MAYYDALIAKWPTVSGATTQEKLDNLNAETVTGSVPSKFLITGRQLFDALYWPDFLALSAANQQIAWNTMLVATSPGIMGGAGTTAGSVFVTLWPLIQITASIAGNTLTVTATSGVIGVNAGNCVIAAANVAVGTKITAQLTGSAGSTGTYTINGAPQTVSSQSMLLETQSIANFTAFAVAVVEPWWQANGYAGPITNNDLAAAGLS